MAKEREKEKDKEKEKEKDRERDRRKASAGEKGRGDRERSRSRDHRAAVKSAADGKSKDAKGAPKTKGSGEKSVPGGRGASDGKRKSGEGSEAKASKEPKSSEVKVLRDPEPAEKKTRVDKESSKVEKKADKPETPTKFRGDHKDGDSAAPTAAAGVVEAAVVAEAASIVEAPKKADLGAPGAAAGPIKLRRRRGNAGAAAAVVEVGSADGCSSYSYGGSSYSDSSTARRRKRKEGREAARSGFSTGLAPPPPPLPNEVAAGLIAYGPAPAGSALAPIPYKVMGLLESSQTLALEVARMKQAMQAKPSGAPSSVKFHPPKEEEGKETVLRMPARLHEALLHPDNAPKMLARTGLASATLNEEGLVVLRAHSRKALHKALGQLRRVAYHCQWGCSLTKVAALLADKPARPLQTVVVRLAATSSRLQSFEMRLTHKVRKLRIGTQAGACQMVVEGIPGLSRKHCTITFEAEKSACYVQDLSTNGTYFNGKRLPRPPYKNPQDARVRVFHGDELFFRLRSDDAEELGYVINLHELS